MVPAASASVETGAPADTIVITDEMIAAVWGSSVSVDDTYDQKERSYAGIFAAMLLASKDAPLGGINKVERRGLVFQRV